MLEYFSITFFRKSAYFYALFLQKYVTIAYTSYVNKGFKFVVLVLEL